MLNRFISLAGLALAISLSVPAAQQARSGYLPDTATPPVPETELVSELSTPAPQDGPVFPPLLDNSAQAAGAEPATTALAAAPQAETTATVLAAAPQTETIRLVIHLSRHEVLVHQGEKTIKRYPIGVGRAGWETPVGTFQVQQMRENPIWISPFTGERILGGDARNPLGTRWIGFWTDGNNWIGFHGTRNPATIGKNASHGCIHMNTADLEELYRQVNFDTSVTVVQ
ncbi:MAG TPA: L,D-transpeptidase [Nodosilinea sp.]|nr:L,D-transpeptidase [Nodosilinea sp.]